MISNLPPPVENLRQSINALTAEEVEGYKLIYHSTLTEAVTSVVVDEVSLTNFRIYVDIPRYTYDPLDNLYLSLKTSGTVWYDYSTTAVYVNNPNHFIIVGELVTDEWQIRYRRSAVGTVRPQEAFIQDIERPLSPSPITSLRIMLRYNGSVPLPAGTEVKLYSR